MAIQHQVKLSKAKTRLYLGGSSGARPTASVNGSGVISITNQPSTMELSDGVTNASWPSMTTSKSTICSAGGFADSVLTTTPGSASITTYFSVTLMVRQQPAVQTTGYDEALALALKARNDKDAELWVEVTKRSPI